MGWLAPPDRPLIIVRNPDQDPADIAWQAAKIGYDNLAGELDGGMAAWTAAGYDTVTHPAGRPDEIDGRRVLDVRQDSEFPPVICPEPSISNSATLPAVRGRCRTSRPW